MQAVTSDHHSRAATQGHVAVYARDARWRRALARSLAEAGHSFGEAGSAAAAHRLLAAQRFDVLALKLRDEQEADELAAVLRDVPPPLHTIVLGRAMALPLFSQRRRGGTFRYVPGSPQPREVCRLIDVSISAGSWEDGAADGSPDARFEEIDLEEMIESAASAVYAQAKRKQQRFASAVSGATLAFGNPATLRRTLADLLRLVVALSPRGARISVDAEAGSEDWSVRIAATNGKRSAAGAAALGEALQDETKTLASMARALHEQGGMLWVELQGPAALALSLTLPLPPAAGAPMTAPRLGDWRKEVGAGGT